MPSLTWSNVGFRLDNERYAGPNRVSGRMTGLPSANPFSSSDRVARKSGELQSRTTCVEPNIAVLPAGSSQLD